MNRDLTIFLNNGTILEIKKHGLSSALFGVRWKEKQSLLLFANKHILELQLHAPHQEFSSAALAGEALENSTAKVPFDLYLMLAFISLKHALPEKTDAAMISEVALFADPSSSISSIGILTDGEIRERAQRAFELRGSEILPDIEGIWNTARYLLLCGEVAWHLKGESAHFWGSFPGNKPLSQEEEDSKWERTLIAKLAILAATRKTFSSLSIPLATSPRMEFVWWDWVALASGPSKPSAALRPGGLGGFWNSLLETNVDPYAMALSSQHAQTLKALAHTLLKQVERPYPRYLGRVLSVQLPLRLLPLLYRWGIDRLLVQVEVTGVYLSVLNQDGKCIGAAWWEASWVSEKRVPMVFPAAAYIVLHGIISAFWKDLCSNAVVVGQKPSSQTSGTLDSKAIGKKKKKKSHHHTRIYLPPVRSMPAEQTSWSNAHDQDSIHRITQTAHWYRLLPAGWEKREETPAFQHRRALAIERARAAFQPDPLPGFTFVHRLTEEELESRARGEKPPSVQARGLLALSLVLQEHAIEFSIHEESGEE